jgi:DNA polymerase-3 subunit alpha
MCISTGKQVTDPARMKHDGVTLWLKSHNEMIEQFRGAPWAAEAIANTKRIADSVELSFNFKEHFMPKFKPPPQDAERPLIEIMAEKARKGLEERFIQLFPLAAGETLVGRWGEAIAKYKERLETEISLIDKMGFAGYFLVVSDFIVWAKEHDIPVGPGRGSCAGSLVAYAMRITEIDPISNKLLFERFLNPDRVSLPDIDVDFCVNGRDRVIKYVIEKYGKENVAQIATFGTLKAKAAIKDVGRALGLSFAETDRIAKLVPAPRQGFDYPLTEALKMEPKLAEYAEKEGKELISLALKLEGLTRHSSTHAAGVVIGDRPLIDMLPMMVDKDGNDVTQYSMTYVEKVGLVKFDFLGLKTLSMLNTALKIIKESRGLDIDLNRLPLADPKTYSLLCAGNTTGVFQLESSGITDMTMRLKPSNFNDLVAILALYRPGPLDAGMVDHYINRKHGREKVSYLHPLMESPLADTYGIIVYQEQIMQLARELAGYTLAEADILRKAMGKKNPEEMAKQRERFIKGAAERKIEGKLANEIFDQMETFARYGFNRSHSAAYALVSFQTAFLKAHYSVEFMAALMSHEMSDSDKTLKNLNECKRQKIAVLPPDVNLSLAGFSVRDGKIRYGLEAIRGIGEKAVAAIIEARGERPFAGLADLLMRVDESALNRRVLEGMIRCGALDFAGVSRRAMDESLDQLMGAAAATKAAKKSGQISLFGGPSANGSSAEVGEPRNLPEWPTNKKLTLEREALGFYLSGHPLERFSEDLKRWGCINTLTAHEKGRTASDFRGVEVKIAGVVTALKLKNTKKGDRYASFVFEDLVGTIEALVWPDTYRDVANLLASDGPVMIHGKVDGGEERCTLVVNSLEPLAAVRDRAAKIGVLNLTERDRFEERLPNILKIFAEHRGNCPIKVELMINGGKVAIALRDKSTAPVCVAASEAVCEQIEQVFGRPVFTFV